MPDYAIVRGIGQSEGVDEAWDSELNATRASNDWLFMVPNPIGFLNTTKSHLWQQNLPFATPKSVEKILVRQVQPQLD